MGSLIEINDTLKISKERGFPKDLTLAVHIANPSDSIKLLGQKFDFWNEGLRSYNDSPTRVFLVEELSGKKWLYWGHAVITSQTREDNKTSGRYRIVQIYQPDFQRQMTIEESPAGRSYFDESPKSFVERK